VTGVRRGALRHATRVQHHSRRHLSNIGLHRIRVRGGPRQPAPRPSGCRQALFAAARALYAAPSATDRVGRPAGTPRANTRQGTCRRPGGRHSCPAVAARRPT
jgi:hypothetical protein